VKVKILLFGQLRELTDHQKIDIELQADATAQDLVGLIGKRFPNTSELLKVTSVSINNEYVAKETDLSEGDLVGLLPPISGG